MKSLVADSSVIAKWYIVEEIRDQAVKLRDDYVEGKIKLSAPTLMPYVLNAVRWARRNISTGTLKMTAESLALYGIKLYHFRGEYADLTVKTVLKNQITIYDVAYVALAKLLNATLYTADEKLKRNLKARYQKICSPHKKITGKS